MRKKKKVKEDPMLAKWNIFVRVLKKHGYMVHDEYDYPCGSKWYFWTVGEDEPLVMTEYSASGRIPKFIQPDILSMWCLRRAAVHASWIYIGDGVLKVRGHRGVVKFDGGLTLRNCVDALVFALENQ